MGFSMFSGCNKIYFELLVSQINGRSSTALLHEAQNRKKTRIHEEKREKKMLFLLLTKLSLKK